MVRTGILYEFVDYTALDPIPSGALVAGVYGGKNAYIVQMVGYLYSYYLEGEDQASALESSSSRPSTQNMKILVYSTPAGSG